MSVKNQPDHQEDGLHPILQRVAAELEDALTQLLPRDDIPEDADGSFSYLVDLVEESRRVASIQANATLTMRNWLIGRAINVNVLRQERADYGKQICATLSHQLTWNHIVELLHGNAAGHEQISTRCGGPPRSGRPRVNSSTTLVDNCRGAMLWCS